MCLAEAEFIMDVNKSFQTGKIRMRGDGNFMTFGLKCSVETMPVRGF